MTKSDTFILAFLTHAVISMDDPSYFDDCLLHLKVDDGEKMNEFLDLLRPLVGLPLVEIELRAMGLVKSRHLIKRGAGRMLEQAISNYRERRCR